MQINPLYTPVPNFKPQMPRFSSTETLENFYPNLEICTRKPCESHFRVVDKATGEGFLGWFKGLFKNDRKM